MYRFTPLLVLRILILLCSSSFVLAQSSTYVNQVVGSPLKGGEQFRVEVNRLNISEGESAGTDYGLDNRFILTVGKEGTDAVSVGEYRVLYQVKYRAGQLFDESSDPQVQIYDLKLTTSSYSGGILPFIPDEVQGAWQMDVEVLSVTFEGGPISTTAARIGLAGEIIEKEATVEEDDRSSGSSAYAMPALANMSATSCAPDYTIELKHPYFRHFFEHNDQELWSPTSTDIRGDIVARVSYVDCAVEYDFEYVFYDRDSEVGQRLRGALSGDIPLNGLFLHNATRLTSKGRDFRVFNLYRPGYVVARYRAVFYDDGLRTYTRWSSAGKQVSDLPDTEYEGRIKVGYKPDYNWQATTNFAEDAKQLPAVSIMDGTMRGRQNLVVQYGELNGPPNPGSEYVIGQQTIYDAMGRPAVSVLPAPIYHPGLDDPNPLRFDPTTLVQTAGGGTTPAGALYGADQVEAAGECVAEAMGTGAGAGKFYSPANQKAAKKNAFVPDAEGYPYAVTRYTPDNTGRVRRQGGVGPRLQVGEHDTKYFYGTVDQYELDRLFGINAGDATHYQKTMVVDPNGQPSISYLDAKGRTVATALAGLAPKNLIPISQVQATFSFTVDNESREVSFTNTSQGGTTYEWNFADLGSSTEQDPSFTFSDMGTYVVCLTTTGPTGKETTCQYVTIAEEGDVDTEIIEDVIQLKQGFNLVSLDVAPADNRITEVFAELIAENKLYYVQGRDTLGGLALWNPKLSETENVLTRLSPGRGYMIGVSEDLEITVTGIRISPDFRPTLYPGVNIVAYLPQEPTAAADYFNSLIPPDGELSFARNFEGGRFFTYRPSYHQEAIFQMQNGAAYEVYIGKQVDGDRWLEANGGEEGSLTGTVYGSELVQMSSLDRDPLRIGSESNMTPAAKTRENVADVLRVATDITNNVVYEDRVETTYTLLVPQSDLYDLCYAMESANFCADCGNEVTGDRKEGTSLPLPPPTFSSSDESNNAAAAPVGGPAGSPASLASSGDCFDCVYDIKIKIQAVSLCGDGEVKLPKPQIFDGIRQRGSMTDCFSDSDTDLSNIRLELGEYVITKTVTVHEPAVESALEQYLGNAECVTPVTKFINDYVEVADVSGCLDCNCDEPSTLTGDCVEFCELPTPCDAMKSIMRGDLTPGGQYARYTIDYTTNENGEYVLPTNPNASDAIAYTYSIFAPHPDDPEKLVFQALNWGNQTVLIGEENKEIAELTIREFVENFKSEWSETLLSIHPEYELYRWCATEIAPEDPGAGSSYQFDEDLRSIDNYEDAMRTYNSSINTALKDGGIGTVVEAIAQRDRFLIKGNGARRTAFLNHPDVDDPESGITAVVERQATTYFGDNWTWNGLETYERDIVWQTLRDIYLSRKSTFVERERNKQYGNTGSSLWTDLQWRCLPQPICAQLDCAPVTDCNTDELRGYYEARVPNLLAVDLIAAVKPEERELALAAQQQQSGTAALDDCKDRCAAYEDGWRDQILACPVLEAQSDAVISTILDEFTKICNAGCTGGEPWGSSSIPDNVVFLDNSGRTTFEEVLSHYIKLYSTVPGCEQPLACQPTLVNFPPPAGTEFYGGTVRIPANQVPTFLTTNRSFLATRLQFLRDGCQCSSCGTPKSITSNGGLTQEATESMARNNRMLTAELAATLTTIARFLDRSTDRSTLFENQEDLLLPAELTPGGQYCAFRDVLNEKHLEGFVSCSGEDEAQQNERKAQHLNARLGWDRSWEEYATVLGPDASLCMICAEPPTGSLAVTETTTCAEEIRDLAEQDALAQYSRYLDRRSADFERAYRDRCLDRVSDRLELLSPRREYHYTLYYYDQAGNLAMTVPPTGVKLLGDGTEVAKYRNNQVDPEEEENATYTGLLPMHTMLTHYRYNGFNEVTLSDAPDKEPAITIYDRTGRATLSRDGRQEDNGLASYTLYDPLGRPTQVGEVTVTESQFATLKGIAQTYEVEVDNPEVEPSPFETAIYARDRFHVTRTYYSTTPFTTGLIQPTTFSLRNRVAATTYKGGAQSAEEYDHASHYDYDIGGNVATLVQDFGTSLGNQRYKRLEYDYDLISGNVHYLHYQRGAADQFTYHYQYDKLNRLSQVFTSEIETAHSRSNLWKREAAYTYYDHGPLKRTVIGQESLQGLDYAYTLQGWIKGLNGSLGNDYGEVAAPDMSMDGYPEATSLAADPVDHRDLYRYANQYFHEDYKPIKGGILNPMDNVLPPDYELFNGNIVRHYQATIADEFRTAGLVGEYDQLNRLRYGTHALYGTPPTRDRSLASALEAPTFDGNGNIHTMDRHYATNDGEAQHNRLNYGYKGGTNLLTSVQATVTGRTSDWQPFDLLRGQHTYDYDASGNLTTETNDAGATTITWNPYGKVDRVATPDGLTSFGYGPDQNRWAKSLERDGDTRTTYYVRDAQGNTLATYNEEGGAAGATLRWKQQYLYGSARLGEVTMDRLMGGSGTPTDFGTRRYELSNHLGNVTTVFEEYTSSYQEGSGQGEFTAPVLTSFREYMPFGLGLERSPGGVSGYRFGFNGKELDDDQEWGQGTTAYDYGFRIYNPAIARFLSGDPLSPDYPWYTPYQYAGNKPIRFVDLDGLEEDDPYPESYLNHKTKVDMSKAPDVFTTRAGVVIRTKVVDGRKWNGPWYWDQVRQAAPEMFDNSNNYAIDHGYAPVSNPQYIKHNPTQVFFKNQILHHHHLDHGDVAYALPQQLHTGKGYTKLWHRFGKTGAKALGFVGLMMSLNDLQGGDIFAESPFDLALKDDKARWDQTFLEMALSEGYGSIKDRASNCRSCPQMGIYYATADEAASFVTGKFTLDQGSESFQTSGFFSTGFEAAHSLQKAVEYGIIYQEGENGYEAVGVTPIPRGDE